MKFLKDRLSKTLVIWRKKQLAPPMHFWRTKARCMTLYIKLRAVLHLQRTLRGRKGRRRAKRRRMWVSARKIQCVLRGHFARSVCSVLRHRRLAYCGMLSRAIIKDSVSASVQLIVQAAAVTIQAIVRQSLAKSRVAAARRFREESAASVVLQCAFRSRKARLGLASKLFERDAAARIQARIRGRNARHHVLGMRKDKVAVMMQSQWRMRDARRRVERRRQEVERQKLERCAIRVQCAWRSKQGRFALMLKRRAKAERDKEERLAALRIQQIQRARTAKRELARFVLFCFCAFRATRISLDLDLHHYPDLHLNLNRHAGAARPSSQRKKPSLPQLPSACSVPGGASRAGFRSC